MPAASPRRTRAVIDSPIGPLTLLAENGSLTGLYMEDREPVGPGGPVRADSDDDANALVLEQTASQLEEYFAGQRQAFDLPLALAGTAFQRSVWDALRDIPYGETTSYGRLAGEIGRPTAARAVGMANGSNPVSIIVPCHRVVGSNGSLTGYGGGLARKQRLLDLERQADRGPSG
ncbi:MAG TPA: methylated-DNA--[protein]-cysteine S-methyltransferase [Streptosporangiaceae bacterium]